MASPWKRAVKAAATAVLVSPRFLFRVEIDAQPDNAQANNQSGNSQTGGKAEPAAAAKHSISDYELASRLSYFLWSSMPDEAALTGTVAATGAASGRSDLRRLPQGDPLGFALENFDPVGNWRTTYAIS